MLDFEKIPVHWINRVGFLIRKELTQRFRSNGCDIAPEEWAVLLILGKNGAQAPSVIANITSKDRTTITRLIDGMIRKSLVARAEDPNDRRRSLIDVSVTGRDLLAELVPVAQHLIDDSMRGISAEDCETTLRTLQKMNDNLIGQQGKTRQGKDTDHAKL